MSGSEKVDQSEVKIGDVLYALRLIEKWSVKETAEKMGVSSSYICDVEANRKNPSLDKLKEYSDLFGIHLSTLLYFGEQGKKCRNNHKKLLYLILQEYAKHEQLNVV